VGASMRTTKDRLQILRNELKFLDEGGYEFLRRLCNRPFSKSPTPFESQRRQSGLSTRCGSEEVERGWSYLVTTKQSARTN